jgi:hypothetical protein
MLTSFATMSSPDLLDQRGVALPMALFTLALLTTLMLAFASLSQTEPVIAANHLRGTQARTLAESGLELAIWALANPAGPGGVPTPLPGDTADPPFDGRTFVPLAAGGFTVRITNHAGGDANRRTIAAVGWVPTNSPTDARPRAHRQVSVDVVVVPPLARRAPCALCVRGALDVVGPVSIEGRNRDPNCGDDAKYGAFSRDATTLTGPVTLSGGAGPSAQQQPAAGLEGVTLSPAALDALKTLAWRNGTYYGPGFPRGGTRSDGSRTWSGRIVFDAANPLPDGVVFVDTIDGVNVADDGPPVTTLAGARLDAGALIARGGVFRGWIVVNGSLEVTGGVNVRGVLYAVDGITYSATGESRLEGLAVAMNTRNASATRIEATSGGSLAITFDCTHATAADSIPRAFTPIPGTYREDAD